MARFICDFHIHSKYSRATSKDMDVRCLSRWAKLKGIDLLGTGDFTHFLWLEELKQHLKAEEGGLFSYDGTLFLLTTEVSNIFSKGGRVKKVHNMIFAPSFEVAERINEELGSIGNLSADGRPTLGLEASELVKIVMGISRDCFIVPAHCLPPDTYIHTKRGIKKIKDISVGELVYTHKSNWRKVTEIFKRRYNGKIYHIRPYYFRNGLKATPEHPFYVIKTYKNCLSTKSICKSDCSHLKKGCRRRYFEKYYPQWVRAKDIENSDVIVFPRFTDLKDIKEIKISDFVKNYKLIEDEIAPLGMKVNKLPNKIKVDKEFCRLVGYFLSEGYTNGRDCISFCFHDDEIEYIEDVKYLMKQIFNIPLSSNRIRKGIKSIELIFYSKILVNLFGNLFYVRNPRRASSKSLPGWMLELPHDKQVEIIKGWWRGDTGYTSSTFLMNQMKILFLRLSIIPSIRLDLSEQHRLRGKHNIGKRKVVAKHNSYFFSNLSFFKDNLGLLEDSCFEKFKTKLKRRHGWVDEKYIYLPVKDVEEENYEGEVYNLEVADDNSYVSEFAVVHNCWTPWFSLFGANSGFDRIEDCFEDQTQHIYALETGLSSDPAMNWRWSALDRYALISNSDAHSPSRIGREANIFSERLDYYQIIEALKRKDREKFLATVEFFPQEGKYHWDGHRNCQVLFSPSQTRENGPKCPKCGRPVTVGVMHRVEKLADRKEGFIPEGSIPFHRLIPLEEIIAEAMGKGSKAAGVENEYKRIAQSLGGEFRVLLEASEEELTSVAPKRIADGILSVREEKVDIIPGYDGVYGKIKIFRDDAKEEEKQLTLF